MNSKKRLIYIGLGVIVDFVIILAVVLTSGSSTSLSKNGNNITAANINVEHNIPNTEDKMIQSEELPVNEEEVTEEVTEEIEENKEEITPSVEIINTAVQEIETNNTVNVSYDEMSIEEKEQALNAGTLALEYSALYTNSSERLSVSKGALYFNGHKETYYSEKVLPGTGLAIPGRHVADDGTIRDQDGYICVATNQEYMAKGTILITSLGPAKVYDSGCAYGVVDIYVSW